MTLNLSLERFFVLFYFGFAACTERWVWPKGSLRNKGISAEGRDMDGQ